jgi:hypothetical protein
MVPLDCQGAFTVVFVTPVIMLSLPEAVAVELPKVCSLAADQMIPLPVSEVGVWEAFMPRPNVGFVPDVRVYVPEHCQNHILATAGRLQEQIVVGETVARVTAEVILQTFPARTRPDSPVGKLLLGHEVMQLAPMQNRGAVALVEAVSVVNAPLEGVVEPIVPGDAHVRPRS